MRRRRHTVSALALGLTLATTIPVAAADPAPATSVWLSGTFGTVLGADPDQPATAAPDGRALETWMRGEMLELTIDPPLGDGTVVMASTARSGDATVDLHVADGRWVTGPEEAGRQTVVATVERPGAEPTEHAWLLDVGDRSGGWETRLQRPAIEASLLAGAERVTGERGHGCLTGFCQEAGYRPPSGTLEPLRVALDEPLRLELGDGSALVSWQGRAEPLPGTASETRLAQATFDEPVAGPSLDGLEPDAPGEWLLEVRADYDRERGWQWYLFRLVAE